jgi:dihydropteroate synthase
VPKDLGVDLLLLKDKRNREALYDKAVEKNVQVIEAEKPSLAELDALGSFTIMVDRVNESVVALHYSSAKIEKPDKIIKGKTAEAIYSKIIKLGLVSREDHAAYLGDELAKAEIALRTGKEYIQDGAMFTK